MGVLDTILSVGSALYPVAGGIAEGVNRSRAAEREAAQEKLRAQIQQAQLDVQRFNIDRAKQEQAARAKLLEQYTSDTSLTPEERMVASGPDFDPAEAITKRGDVARKKAALIATGQYTPEQAESVVRTGVDPVKLRREQEKYDLEVAGQKARNERTRALTARGGGGGGRAAGGGSSTDPSSTAFGRLQKQKENIADLLVEAANGDPVAAFHGGIRLDSPYRQYMRFSRNPNGIVTEADVRAAATRYRRGTTKPERDWQLKQDEQRQIDQLEAEYRRTHPNATPQEIEDYIVSQMGGE